MIRVAARRGSLALGMVLAVLLYAACSASTPAEGTVTASLLVEATDATPQWFVDVTLEGGGNGYELLETAVEGSLDAEWSSQFGSHFVSGIMGIQPAGDAFWGFFVWNEATQGWEPLMVGADLWDVEDGQVMAWAIVTFDQDTSQLPVTPGVPPNEQTS